MKREKISDKQRLDWLIYRGNLWSEDCADTNALWQAQNSEGVHEPEMARGPRRAIDAAVRAERRLRRKR